MPARAAHVQLDAEPFAQGRAVRRVGAGLLAQAVVEVQRGDVRGPGDPDGDVEQADGVAAAREQHEHRAPGLEQPGGAYALEQVSHPAPAREVAVGEPSLNGTTPDRIQSGGTSIVRATSAAVTSAIRSGTLAARGRPEAPAKRKRRDF